MARTNTFRLTLSMLGGGGWDRDNDMNRMIIHSQLPLCILHIHYVCVIVCYV